MRIKIAQDRFISIINVYAPTMTYPEEEREAFYQQLRGVLTEVPAADKIILRDLNARVQGADHVPPVGKH